MKYILLPGFSKNNKEWAEDLQKEFKLKDIELTIVEWDHWTTGKSSFNMRLEKEKIQNIIKNESEYIVLAKSVGTRLAAVMMKGDLLKPNKFILMGIPSQNEVYKEALSKLKPEQIVVIQNKNDPFNSFEEMKHFISQINPNIKVIEGERNDHSYPYPDLLLRITKYS